MVELPSSGMKNLVLYFAIVKEHLSSGEYVHDGFMPYTWDTTDYDSLEKKIRSICSPMFNSESKLVVHGKQTTPYINTLSPSHFMI